MEVKRFSEKKISNCLQENPQGFWIKAEDFDRVTAERDALQQRLNAVEEENDRLKEENRVLQKQMGDLWKEIEALRTTLENRS